MKQVTDTVRHVKRAAVVVHPGKHDDLQDFQSTVGRAMANRGWAEPLWLETSLADTGEELARSAVKSGVDVVLASGGDGTITACVAGVAGTGVPLGVLPCGTGNLLARNLGLPFDLDAALTVALTGNDRPLDVGEVNGQTFVVMAGLGFDAVMLAGTSELLKKHAGWLAYALSGLRHLWDWPTRMIIKADDGPPLDRSASGVIIGNVGTLQGNVQLLPDAVPDDGVLDVAVLTAVGAIGWLMLAFNVLRRRKTIQVTWLTCRELVIETRHARPWQVDGDVIGFGRRLVVRVRPASLLVRVPVGPAA